MHFIGLENLKKRSADGSADASAPYHAIGVINYHAADGGTADHGLILYVKAGYHGVESAGVRNYATLHADFPHESTNNQWFTESQLESYRSLGFEIMDRILRSAAEGLPDSKAATLPNLIEQLHARAEADEKDQAKANAAPG